MRSEPDITWDSPRAVPIARVMLVAVALLTLLPANHLIPLVDRDEPRFARATEEMILRNEWIVPYFNDEYRFDKPILIYWLMRVAYGIFGINEFAARLPSVIFAVLYGLVVFEMGRRWFDVRAGFFAAFGLLTCAQMLIHGRSAVADMPMVVAVALSQWAAYELLHNAEDAQTERRWFWILYTSLGLGFLAKGPVAWVVPALAWPAHRWIFWRRALPWRKLRLAQGLPITAAIVAAWGIPALIKTRGLFWRVGMGSHVWERGLETFQGHGGFIFYYLVAALFSYFPWSAWIPGVAIAARRKWFPQNAFLVSWLASTYLLFSLYRTKLPHYIMPAFPAFFLMLGRTLADPANDRGIARGWRRAMLGLGLALGVAALIAGAIAPLPIALKPLRLAALGAASLLFSLVYLAAQIRKAPHRSLFAAFAGIVVALTLIGVGLRATSPAVQIRAQFSNLPRDTVCGFAVFKEPSLVFYLHRRWQPLDLEEASDFLRGTGPRLLVCEERERRIEDPVRRLLRKPPRGREYSAELNALPSEGYQISTVEGLNLARASVTRLRVFYRAKDMSP